VREQPFSVILLDEIVKAHPNIFDLFLQVFDDGRLTDSQGRLADFRHTIIIMTSNLASAFSPGGPLGFDGDEGDSLASPQGALREVKRFFRPEFINRIDRTVVFRPLRSNIMGQIAQRELGKVLMRSGLLRRKLVVDIEPSVVDFLMAQGFSQAFGARPLKRAVEAEVLLPVAREIVRRGPGYTGDLLKVSASTSKRAVEVERASTDMEARRQAILDAGADGLMGTGLEGLVSAPRSRKEAQKRFSIATARLEVILDQHCPQQLLQALKKAEHDTADVTFWDDADKVRASLIGLAQKQRFQEAIARLKSRQEDLESGLEKKSKTRLRDWHDQFVAWLVDLHLSEEMVAQMGTTLQGRET
jgi:ATP-dependent Clp protease ATP-binding subunit ClpC